MYEIEIYEDKEGYSELKDWLRELKHRKDRGIKDSRIILNQIHYCIERIKSESTYASEDIVTITNIYAYLQSCYLRLSKTRRAGFPVTSFASGR